MSDAAGRSLRMTRRGLQTASSRRKFLGGAMAAVAGALVTGCGKEGMEAFLQHNFRELSKDELDGIIRRLEGEAQRKYGKKVRIGNEPAMQGVVFGYALDLSRCVGCRRCVHACVKENNSSREPEIQWIRVLQMEKEKGVDLEAADAYYNP